MRLGSGTRLGGAAWLAVTVLAGGNARADDELPSYRTLPCVTKCANAVAAEPIFRPAPHFPLIDAGVNGHYVEGFVDIRFTIGTDGLVRDVAIERLIGPKEFANAAVDACKQRTYKPAQVNGKPVEEVSIVRYEFRVPNGPRGARSEIAEKYTDALSLIHDGKLDDALALLIEAQSKPRLNFYERTMIAYVSALIYVRREDYLSAAEAIDLATIHNGRDLDSRVVYRALNTKIQIDLRLGQMAEAQRDFELLKQQSDFKSDDPIVKLVADVKAKADSMDQFSVLARIPQADDRDSWHHLLYRRAYRFQNIKGSLERFQLSCDQQAIESPISETAQWHVPPDWSNCYLIVHGAPGTTFELVEAN
jgi:TonB family protein